eukprot:COSAG06_NODE_5864_length_3239_cov_18.100955_2_plen_278_part_00
MLAADDTSGSTAAGQDGAAPSASWCGTHERFAESPSPVLEQHAATDASTDTIEPQTALTSTNTDTVEVFTSTDKVEAFTSTINGITDTVEQQTDAASATDTNTDKVELNSRPATCAPTLSGAAAEAAAAVAPLGVAALIDLPADMTTPAKDDAFQHSRRAQPDTARRPLSPPAVAAKGSSILGKGSLFERSAEEATPPAFGSAVTAAAAAAVPESPSTDEAEPPAKKVKFAEALAPVAAMAAGLKQVIDAAEENKATDDKAALALQSALPAAVIAEQ